MSLDETGFTIETLEDIKAGIESDLKAALGPELNTLATSVFGQIIGVFSDRLAELEELAEAVHRSQYRDSATGEALDNVGALTGAPRLAATKSSFKATNSPANQLTLNLDAGVTVLAGAIVRIPSGARFVTLEDATNSGGSPDDILVDAEAEDYGPVAAFADTVTEIVTPVSGWNTVNNDADVDLGRDEELDPAYRLRQEELLHVAGGGSVDAIRSDVLELEGVVECFVFENTTDLVDGDGVPAHAFEVVVDGGDAAQIARAIWDSKAAGIRSYGNSTESVVDDQGFSHDVGYSRPTVKSVYVTVDLVTDPATYPVDGDDQVKAQVAAYGDALGIGDDVVTSAIYPYLFEVSGVLDVVSVKISFAPAPTLSANLTIGTRELADIDTANVGVV